DDLLRRSPSRGAGARQRGERGAAAGLHRAGRQRHRRARQRPGQEQEPAAAVRRGRPQLHVPAPACLRPRSSDESRQAAADPSRLRRGLPAAATGAAGRNLGVSVTARALGDALTAIVGPAGVAEAAAARAAMAVDGREPQWVVRPRTLDEAAAVVALAHDEKLALIPRGRGTAQALGVPPERVDVVLDLAGLDTILEHNPEDMTATVQAGVTAGALAARLAAHRQALPLDPPGWGGRTVGGIAATAASGPLRARYGTMRDLLLGIRFVQADGVVTWGGAKVVKSVTGYDIPKLLVGSLGT